MNKWHKISVKQLIYSALVVTIVTSVCAFLPNESSNSAIVGIALIIISAINVILCRKNKMLLVLFSIIFYINLSIAVPGFINNGKGLAYYQIPLWTSDYATIYAKSLLIVSSVFSIFFCDISKYKEYNDTVIDKKHLEPYDNPLLSIISLLILVLIFIFCFDGTSVLTGGLYSSNENALYEYSIFFFALAWLYGSSRKYIRIAWVVLASYYVIIGILTGDRSSCFMVIVMVVLYLWRKANLFKISIYAILGVIFANGIAIFRNLMNYNGLSSIVSVLLSNGNGVLFSDTAYYSCHSGLTILAYSELYNGSKIILFLKWLVSLVTGDLFIKGNEYELVVAAREFNYNGGGGVFPAYFYFYGGLIGVAIASIITAYIIKRIYFKEKGEFSIILRYIIPAMSLRWYLYSPATLYRSCLINFGIIFLGFMCIHNLLLKRKRND